MATSSQRPLELWGGIECTINRVGDRFFSQLERSGHIWRSDDLDRIAALGIRTLRYPVLWEQLAPESLDEIDWRWADERLGRLRELSIRPIVGLVHHGSGPRYTDLTDPEFAAKLARFAGALAERYPWLDAFTPINEPLTTARFSGLYGHWYPHGCDELTFARCFLNQIRAVVLAMRAIREVNPGAQLVQTEDLGKTFATPRLQYQADFENERRWITWDLLCGKVGPDHRMSHHMRWLGIADEEIAWFATNPCPPQIVGVNYYVTSERFLDEKLSTYPPETHGGNGRDRYVDVAAVRARDEGLLGPNRLLREVCKRYSLPVAVTEAHLGCSRPEQLRWLNEMWESAKALRADDFDVCAVTAWSLLGAHDWDTLLTRQNGHYESGAFDLRGVTPRPTAIARMIRELSASAEFHHPALSVPGWWHRPIRFAHRFAEQEEPFVQPDTRPLLIIGDNGVADGFAFGARERALAVRRAGRSDDLDQIVDTLKPWAIVDCGSNDGEIVIKCRPEAGELQIQTGVIFGTGGADDFIARALHDLADGREVRAASDVSIPATYLPDLNAAVLDLLIDDQTGTWYLANRGAFTPADLARMAAELANFDPELVVALPSWSLGQKPNEQNRGVASEHHDLLPSLTSAIRHYVGVIVPSLTRHERISAC
jgi:dTDP-4-dehydrorhamnose reductase